MMTVYTDHEKVSQILFNLLNTAVKSTHKGTITVGAEVLPDDDTVLLKVRDNSIGLNSGEKEALQSLL